MNVKKRLQALEARLGRAGGPYLEDLVADVGTLKEWLAARGYASAGDALDASETTPPGLITLTLGEMAEAQGRAAAHRATRTQPGLGWGPEARRALESLPD